jgi:uncharacterized protein
LFQTSNQPNPILQGSVVHISHFLSITPISKRYRAIGANMRGMICVVFAIYGTEAISVISMRPASNGERKAYEENRR